MMSYSEKPEDITKEEWMDKLNNVHIQRADMNRLIMNYLVTGRLCDVSIVLVRYTKIITLYTIVLCPFKSQPSSKANCPSKKNCFCSTEGFKEAAEKFRLESGIDPNVDLDSLDERIKIREMVLKGQIQEAIALINSLHPELLDTNRYLYFHLQVNSSPHKVMLGERCLTRHVKGKEPS